MSLVTELLNEQIKAKFIDSLYTSLPAVVEKVSEFQSMQVVDVKPLIGKIDEDGVETIPPVIHNVPVILMGGGGALFSIPIAVGDTVLVMFSMRDMSRWKKQDGNAVIPDSSRMHNINDAVAIPGLFTSQSNLNPDPADVVIKFSESEIRIAASGDVNITAPNVVINHATSLELGAGATEALVLGDAFKAIYDAHTHPTGVGPSGVPVIPLPANNLSTSVTVK